LGSAASSVEKSPGSLDGATAVVLAGGVGSRLRPVVADRPKPLADIAGRPFLAYLLDELVRWGIVDIVLCTGYLGEQISARFGEAYRGARLQYSQESQPLGTAGALRLALPLLRSDTVLVLNGDSFCRANLAQFGEWHSARRSLATMLLVKVPDTGRYGRVQLDDDARIVQFEEKGRSVGPGLINAGLYLVQRPLLEIIPEVATVVSLERDIFPLWIRNDFRGYETSGAFLDIGTPESFAQAQKFFAETAPG
jgi:D-glycero-alpha-D-manno-heptose 1-phosphate guanylyltransferase